ncbi:hypothetical protein Slin15195_G097010 [Septoria linicola]|uniref:DUF998 domain-containing protein n=1 Tax=Septoria linicola TaxID=215465 RepID=A0A9Q9B2T8_9PEZI|nr:hypothetical protein Slin14017_G060100 [Septoria linicola]USW56382.1 hypothetical protein Slin15195_G097010 [Septoria linicola]
MSTVTSIKKESNSPTASYKLNSGTAVLACIIYFLTPALYLGIEYYVSLDYAPSYSYRTHYTSQLAVPDEYVERNTGRTAFSPRAHLMNYMFIANGLLYLIGQRLLLGCFDKTLQLATTRIFLAMGHCIGFILVAAVPGGPKQEEAGIAWVHFVGALLAIVMGNVNSLITGIVTPQWGLHKIISLACGTVGLCSTVLFFLSVGRGPSPGLWQRLSLYPTQLWMFFTADMLMAEISKLMKELDKEEEAKMKKQE